MTDPLRSRLERLLVLMQATIGAAREYPPDAPTKREVVLATMQGWADDVAALLREPPEAERPPTGWTGEAAVLWNHLLDLGVTAAEADTLVQVAITTLRPKDAVAAPEANP